jgi:hypothetical protein
LIKDVQNERWEGPDICLVPDLVLHVDDLVVERVGAIVNDLGLLFLIGHVPNFDEWVGCTVGISCWEISALVDVGSNVHSVSSLAQLLSPGIRLRLFLNASLLSLFHLS